MAKQQSRITGAEVSSLIKSIAGIFSNIILPDSLLKILACYFYVGNDQRLVTVVNLLYTFLLYLYHNPDMAFHQLHHRDLVFGYCFKTKKPSHREGYQNYQSSLLIVPLCFDDLIVDSQQQEWRCPLPYK